MNDNTFTLEDAMESINSYISEANAFNKYMDKRADELAKLGKKYKKFGDILGDPTTTSRSVKKAAGDKLSAARDKQIAINDAVAASTGGNQRLGGYTTVETKYRKRGYKGDDPAVHFYARKGKKEWMKAHGDVGEDKVAARKPGRFKMESVEDRISASRLQVFEAFEAGLIDEDEKYAMLEMLDIDNYQ